MVIDTTPSLEAFVFTLVKLVTDELDTPLATSAYDAPKFKQTMHAFGTSLSSEASKFALAFKPPAIAEHSEACSSLLKRLEQLHVITNTIPLEQGRTLSKEVLDAGKDVFKASISLGNSFLPQPIRPDLELTETHIALNDNKKYLKSTGLLWETCEALKVLSADNKEAVLKKWKFVLGLVDDAVKEIQDMLDEATMISSEETLNQGKLTAVGSKNVLGENENDESASEAIANRILPESNDKNLSETASSVDLEDFSGLDVGEVFLTVKQESLVKSACSLFKLCRLLLVKISVRSIPECDSSASNIPVWLDQLLEKAEKLSDKVDDLASNLWERENKKDIQESLEDLLNVFSDTVKLVLLHSDEKHTTWFNGSKEQFLKLKTKIIEDLKDCSSV